MFLQHLALSSREMTVHEIAEVVTVDIDASGELLTCNAHLRYTDARKVVSICYGLATEVDSRRVRVLVSN